MVYLLKNVIFHGYVSHNQIVNHAWTKFEHGMVMNQPLDINTFLSGFMMIYGCVWTWDMTRWRSQEKKNVDESSKSGGLKSCFQTHSNHIFLLNLLVVYLPLLKNMKVSWDSYFQYKNVPNHQPVDLISPLVNIQKAMENHHVIAG